MCELETYDMNNSYCQDFTLSKMFIIIERGKFRANRGESGKGGDRCGRGSQEERNIWATLCDHTFTCKWLWKLKWDWYSHGIKQKWNLRTPESERQRMPMCVLSQELSVALGVPAERIGHLAQPTESHPIFQYPSYMQHFVNHPSSFVDWVLSSVLKWRNWGSEILKKLSRISQKADSKFESNGPTIRPILILLY